MNPNRPKNAIVIERLPALNRGRRNTSTSSIGWSMRRSQTMNAPRSAMPVPNPAMLAVEVQPWCGPSMIAQTSAVTPTIDSTMPSGSNRSTCGSRLVGT